MSKKVPAEIVLKEIKEKNPSIEVIGKYQSKGSPLLVRCRTCGFEWESNANRLLFGCGCRKCAGVAKRGVSVSKKTHDQFVSELAEKMPDMTVLSTYKNARTKIDCRCKLCGFIWQAKPSNLLAGFGCPECARISVSAKQLKTHSEFENELRCINPTIEAIGKYNGNHTNIKMRCMKCGEIWEATPANMLRKDGHATGCPHCKTSHGEADIKRILNQNNLSFIQWKTFSGLLGIKGRPLSYDFYIPNLNLLIEYQGEFHDHTARIQCDEDFAVQEEHDRRKKEYAQSHGIRLLEIWYYDSTEEKLEQELHNITDPVTTTAS